MPWVAKVSKGFFLAIEGCDGAGKSTIRDFCAKWLEDHRVPTILTREPGGTLLAEKIRDLVKWGDPLGISKEDFPVWAEVCLFNASRATHLENMVIPRMEEGYVIVSDRFVDSTYAYQGGGRGLELAKLQQLHAICCRDFQADLTIVLDGDPEVFYQRAAARSAQDRMERAGIEFQHRCRAMQQHLISLAPERYRVVDAEQSIESVQAQLIPILSEIVNRMKARPTL